MEPVHISILIGLTSGLLGYYIGTLHNKIKLFNALQKTITELEQNIINLLKEVKEANILELQERETQKTDGLIGDFAEKDLLQFSLKMAVNNEDYKKAAFIRDILKMKYGEDSSFE